MNYSNIKYYDIANGEGVRCSLFVSGCRNHCKGCFNKETWDFNNGNQFTKGTEDKIIKFINQPYIKGLSILGGDPFEPENIECLLPFMQRVVNECPDKDIWVWTGYTYEILNNSNNNNIKNVFQYIDVLIDGRFEEDKKDISLHWKGSSNQRVIDVKKTLASNKIILLNN